MSAPADTPKTCPLLTLPRELRDIIIDYTFSHVVEVYTRNERTIGTKHSPAARNGGLLLTCKQLYTEAKKPYFERSIFHFVQHKDVWLFLDSLEVEERRLIRNLHCDFYGGWWGYRRCTKQTHGECIDNRLEEFKDLMRGETMALQSQMEDYGVEESAVRGDLTLDAVDLIECMCRPEED